MKKKSFLLALKASLPVFFCYFPLGIVYGLLFTEYGNPWFYAPLFSLFVLAGAMQFLALSIGPEASLLTIALSLIPLGIRNIFYGLTMKERFRKIPVFLKYYLAHGLVDATYSILTLQPKLEEKKEDIYFITSLTLLIHLYWVFGTLIGSAFGDLFVLPKGLEFSLTAFFAAMLTEQFIKNRDFYPLYIGSLALGLAIFFFPHHLFLGAVGISALACLFVPKRGLI